MSEEGLLGSHGLTTRFNTLHIVAAAAAVLVASLVLIFIQFLSLRSALLDDLHTQAQIIGDNGASALLFNDRKMARKTLDSLGAMQFIRQAELINPQGDVIAAYRREDADFVAEPWPQEGYHYGSNSMDLVEEIRFDGQNVGWVRLRASLTALYARLWSYAGTTLLVYGSALTLALLLVARMRRVVSRAESRLKYLAHTDSVTRLPNRNAFNGCLAMAADRAERLGGSVALLVMDLDNFKLVNDSLGHHSGDSLLTLVAERLRNVLRREDTVCRIGGDEFAVILENTHREIDAAHIAQKILGSLLMPIVVGNQEIFITASIGISFFPNDAQDTQELIRNADTALYVAKAQGKGRFEMYTPVMNERAQQRLSLESRLRRALEREEFVLHYQPQVEMASGRVIGVEALLRWNEGGGGLIGPMEFIPVAEESGLIGPIGQWVLNEACAQVRRWQEAGLPSLRVAVNLSARQFDASGLLQQIRTSVDAAGIRSEAIELEITESALMQNTGASAAMLQQLSGTGFSVAVDDFGTGYSSMSYLKRFPIHRLKIDRSFVTDLTEDRDDAAIVAAIIAMAHALGLEVIAEGVETREQYHKLREMGCDIAQGYLINKPLPAAELERFLAAPGEISELSFVPA